MTTITQTISALDPVPSRDDPDNFDTEADQFLGKLPTMRTELNTLGGQINTVAAEVNANAAAAATSAGAANTAKLDAQAARDIAQAAANFKGTWASLVGALNKPASVHHNGAFWALLNNLANVATSEPGVSGDWVAIGAPQTLTGTTINNPTIAGGTQKAVAYTGVDKGTVSAGAVVFSYLDGCAQEITLAAGTVEFQFADFPAAGKGVIEVDVTNANLATLSVTGVSWKKPDGTLAANLADYLSSINRSALTASETIRVSAQDNGVKYGWLL